MIGNMERVVLLSLFTPICGRPLPSGGFSRKADLLLPLYMHFYHKHISFIHAAAFTFSTSGLWLRFM